jgi:hypothetical protein
MQFPRNAILGLAATAVLSVLVACGSGSGTTTPALVRLVNASDVPLTESLNGTYDITAVPAFTVSTYVSVPPGTYTNSVSSSNGSLSASNQELGIGTGASYTTIAYPRDNVVVSSTITDNLSAPATGYTTLDVANISLDAGSLDVYIEPVGTTSLAGQAPEFSGVQGLSFANTFSSGTYAIFVTGADQPNDVRLHIPSVTFASTQIGTLALTGTSGGALVDGAVIIQGGAVTFYANGQARVRVLSALPIVSSATAQVSVTVGTTALQSDYAPIPTPYALVPSGSTIASITITPPGGAPTAVTLPTSYGTGTSFANGQDYTILVYGSNTAPIATILADNNQVTSNFANVRLINAADQATSGVTLSVGGKQIDYQVEYGTASSYGGVQPNSASSTLDFNSGDYNVSTTFSFVTGSVYSVLIYDVTQPPFIILDSSQTN